MSDWIKAANPFAPIDNQTTALMAARLSAIGMMVGAVNNLAEGWYSSTGGGAEATQTIVENMTGRAQSAAEAQMSGQVGLVGVAVIVLLQLGLAAFQWKKPNQVLPLLFLVLVVWAFFGTVLGLISPDPITATGATVRPMWLALVTLVTMAIAGIFHVAGIRGTSALAKFKQAQAY